MIVEDNRIKSTVRFKDLDCGDVFILHNQFFMKTFTVDTYGFGQAWCFDKNHFHSSISLEEIVQKVNAKIVIYD